MIYKPDLETMEKYIAGGEYKIMPVSCEILSDFITPIEALRKLKRVSRHCYMLESANADKKWGRYTFLGFDPKMCITCIDGKLKTGDLSFETNDPSGYVRQILSEYKSPQLDFLPPFTGGLVGYFSYDYLSYSEPSVKDRPDIIEDRDTAGSSASLDDISESGDSASESGNSASGAGDSAFGADEFLDEGFKDMDLMLFDKVIAFDNATKKIVLIVNMRLADGQTGYNKAVLELGQLRQLLLLGEESRDDGGRLLGEVKPLFEKERFCAMVEKGKEHIKEGDIFQIVLSNRLSAPFEGSLLNTYRMLRTVNPSPYMFYFSGTDMEVAGASPETLVKLENGVLYTFPLAGTRRRGKDDEEDKALEEELLADEKELAEHNMLVDLGRNDLGKISRFGTVEVKKLHSIERFSHVMHIGSTVRGLIREDKDALDAVEAVLPAGTLSGAPKIRACQLIGELENNKRGIYGGAIGYIAFTGNMDTCIAIRIVYKKNGNVYVRSGAGIVADSDPGKEFEECMNKARASLTALEMASREELSAEERVPVQDENGMTGAAEGSIVKIPDQIKIDNAKQEVES